MDIVIDDVEKYETGIGAGGSERGWVRVRRSDKGLEEAS